MIGSPTKRGFGGGGMRLLGLLIAIAGAAGLAWGIYRVMEIGTCSSGGAFQTARECPSGTGSAIGLIVGGVIVSIIGALLAGMPGFVITFVFLGIGLGSLAAGLFGDIPGGSSFPLIFGAGFTVFALLPFGLAGFGRRRKAQAQQLVATGRRGVGTLLAVEDTGVTVNENPRIRMRFRIEPQDGGPAYEAEKTATVSRVAVPRAGDRFPVWVDPSDPTRFAVGIPETAEARERVRQEFGIDTQSPAGAGLGGDPVARIAKLDELRRSGAIDDEEYERLKDRVLNEG